MTTAKSTLMIALILSLLIFPTAASAAINAEAVVTGKCTACHMADRIRDASKTKPEWTAWVDKEINRGAQLTAAERLAVIAWLAANYGKTELAASGNTPTQPQNQEVAQADNSNQTGVSAAKTSTQTPTQTLPFNQQAETGVELWQFLLSGGALVGGGALLRRRKN